jgi:hypothetical protein
MGKLLAPRISNLNVKPRGRRATVRFRLSEAATVELRLVRKGHRARTLRRTGTPGANKLELRRLARARYRVTVRASDAGGNAATIGPRKFRTRR